MNEPKPKTHIVWTEPMPYDPDTTFYKITKNTKTIDGVTYLDQVSND